MGPKAKHKGLVLALPNQTLLTSKLADAPVSESLTRYANCPAFRALREMKKLPRIGLQKKHGHTRLAGMVGFLKRHLQTCLRGDLQKSRSIRAANKPRGFSASPFDLRLPFGAAPFGPTFGCSSLRPPWRSVVLIREIRG